MKKILYSVLTVLALVGTTSCADFLADQKPQGVLDSDMVKEPSNVDNLVISAYAVFTTAEMSTHPSRCGTSMFAAMMPIRVATEPVMVTCSISWR